MNEMIDRVARAICSSVDGRNPDHLIAVYEDRPCVGGGILLPIYKRDWENYLTQARAAIEMMREPTTNVLDAGANAKTSDGFLIGEYDALESWHAMIDEILNPTPADASAASSR